MASRHIPSLAPGARGFDVLADQVLATMESQRVSVSELAQRSGVPRETLSAWLNGRRPMRADYLVTVLGVLELAVTPKR